MATITSSSRSYGATTSHYLRRQLRSVCTCTGDEMRFRSQNRPSHIRLVDEDDKFIIKLALQYAVALGFAWGSLGSEGGNLLQGAYPEIPGGHMGSARERLGFQKTPLIASIDDCVGIRAVPSPGG
ncbi:hypothetical protein FQN51_001390 [Onygenales sp. PD_10]|nr:hypothetical protein FQN51_001390 [Onygenales sp. PD_10]